jgi:lysophospholipase L1-like esterase
MVRAVVLVLAGLAVLATSLPLAASASADSSRPAAAPPGIAAAATTPYRIVFAGSSTTAGQAASTAEKRYVNLLVSALHARYGTGARPFVRSSTSATFGAPSSAAGVHGYNAGEPGTNAATYLTSDERTRLIALDPDLVVHMIGSNDFKQQRPVVAFRSDVARVLAGLAIKTPSARHLLVHSYQRLDVVRPRIPWSAYGTALERLAAADPAHVSFVDLSSAYAAVGVPGADPRRLVGSDRVHQTDAGHVFMARRLIDPVIAAD